MSEPKTFLAYDRIMVTPEFIEKNNLKLRSQEEIAKEMAEIIEEKNFMDFRPEVIIHYLNWEHAKPFLTEEYVKAVESGEKVFKAVDTIEECVQDFLDYMNFAWGKSINQRGISASRSVAKLGMWAWLMNRQDISDVLNDDYLYNPYGAPALIKACEMLGITVPEELIPFSKIKE